MIKTLKNQNTARIRSKAQTASNHVKNIAIISTLLFVHLSLSITDVGKLKQKSTKMTLICLNFKFVINVPNVTTLYSKCSENLIIFGPLFGVFDWLLG